MVYSSKDVHQMGQCNFSIFYCFENSNGVKQGGIISPILFNVYMDGLSVLLNSSNIGGQIGHTFLNHLCYADDLCLISLSSAGMQKLLNLCSKYAVDHSLTYNAKKSFSLCYIPRTVKIRRPQLYLDTLVQGVYLMLVRSPEASAYHLGLVQSWASGPNVAIHHNKFTHIFACLYSVCCVTHISAQLA